MVAVVAIDSECVAGVGVEPHNSRDAHVVVYLI